MNVQSLSQAELDDAFHLAIFECDAVTGKVVHRLFRNREEQFKKHGVADALWTAFRDDLINTLLTAFHDVEMEQLGDDRYQAMVERLRARMDPVKPQ